jgi:hypothetical protein
MRDVADAFRDHGFYRTIALIFSDFDLSQRAVLVLLKHSDILNLSPARPRRWSGRRPRASEQPPSGSKAAPSGGIVTTTGRHLRRPANQNGGKPPCRSPRQGALENRPTSERTRGPHAAAPKSRLHRAEVRSFYTRAGLVRCRGSHRQPKSCCLNPKISAPRSAPADVAARAMIRMFSPMPICAGRTGASISAVRPARAPRRRTQAGRGGTIGAVGHSDRLPRRPEGSAP